MVEEVLIVDMAAVTGTPTDLVLTIETLTGMEVAEVLCVMEEAVTIAGEVLLISLKVVSVLTSWLIRRP